MEHSPTFAFYSEHFAKLDEGRFDAALPDALARVNERIAHRWLDEMPPDEVEAYMMAVCAVCEIVDEPVLSSWSAGKTSERYADNRMMRTAAVIDRYLSGTRRQLLYGAAL